MSNEGTFGKNFDLVSLENDYCSYATKSTYAVRSKNKVNRIRKFIRNLKNKKLSDCLNVDYANPVTEEEYILTGLMLGYPIETTASILWNE